MSQFPGAILGAEPSFGLEAKTTLGYLNRGNLAQEIGGKGLGTVEERRGAGRVPPSFAI